MDVVRADSEHCWGLTGFLPVSSSGHLILVGDLLNFLAERHLRFSGHSAWRHHGRCGAVLEALFGPCAAPALCALCGHAGHNAADPHIAACQLAGAFAALDHQNLPVPPGSGLGALVVGAVIMIFVERRKFKPSYITLDDMTPKLALGIGCFQCLALWPVFAFCRHNHGWQCCWAQSVRWRRVFVYRCCAHHGCRHPATTY